MKYEQEIYFHLKSNTLSTGKGAVELSISHLNEWEINGNFKVNCGLYSIDDGNLIYPAENNVPFELRNTQGSPSSIKDKTFSSFENDTTKSTYKIPVGDYEFIVNYINDNEDQLSNINTNDDDPFEILDILSAIVDVITES